MNARLVLCPICLESVEWAGQDLFLRDGGKYVPLATPTTNPNKLAVLRRSAYWRCPNPAGDTADHYLPWAYASYRPPVVVGLVGDSRAGKSHLLAGMILEIERGGLQPYGLGWEPLDAVRHAAFHAEVVERVLGGERLPPTNPGVVEFADALLIKSPVTGSWPVAFFDIAGEGFQRGEREGRFVIGTRGLIFVVDPATALGVVGAEPGNGGRTQDLAFAAVLAQLRALLAPGQTYLDLAAVMVVNKADRLRLRHPVDTWMRPHDGDGHVDPARIRAESRDAYAFLYQHRSAWPWLAPFDTFRRCTLHFASATGGEERDGRYPRGFRPRRVLEPLVALFAMTGVLAGPEMTEVGI
ncbi:MAG TPA: hypothetical protein VFB84_06075 [Micromonosporaceae bacterium]|nr:hypothetical protein [Micromonosporaceae bacterium]